MRILLPTFLSPATPKLRPQVAPSLTDHPQATMSSITLNVNAVKVKYDAHMEEIKRLEANYKGASMVRELGKPSKEAQPKKRNSAMQIRAAGNLLVQGAYSQMFDDEESYQRVICLIPSQFHVYIPP